MHEQLERGRKPRDYCFNIASVSGVVGTSVCILPFLYTPFSSANTRGCGPSALASGRLDLELKKIDHSFSMEWLLFIIFNPRILGFSLRKGFFKIFKYRGFSFPVKTSSQLVIQYVKNISYQIFINFFS